MGAVKLLFVVQRPPYKSENPRLALTHAIASQTAEIYMDDGDSVVPTMVFMGDGVLNMVKNQQAMKLYGVTSTENHIKSCLMIDLRSGSAKRIWSGLGSKRTRLSSMPKIWVRSQDEVRFLRRDSEGNGRRQAPAVLLVIAPECVVADFSFNLHGIRMNLKETSDRKEAGDLKKWFDVIAGTYPEDTAGFLKNRRPSYESCRLYLAEDRAAL